MKMSDKTPEQELDELLDEYGTRFKDGITYLQFSSTEARIAAVREALETDTKIPEPSPDVVI